MTLIFDDRALADFEGIYHWIAQDSPRAAKAVVDRVFASTELLASFPYIGRAGHEDGTREWSCRARRISWSTKFMRTAAK